MRGGNDSRLWKPLRGVAQAVEGVAGEREENWKVKMTTV